jgi:hypothetical protein
VRHGTTPEVVDAALARHPNARGAAKLRAVLHGDVHILLSKLEQSFVGHVRDLRRPRPVTNRRTGSHYVDCRWPEHHLTVELDSYRYHRSRYAWERDLRREREAYARGDEFRRYTWGDVFEDSRAMRQEICELLPAI